MNIKPFIQSEIKVIFLSIIKNQQLLKCFSYLNEIRFHTEFSQLCRNLISTVRKASFFFSPFLLNTEKSGPIVWGAWWYIPIKICIPGKRGVSLWLRAVGETKSILGFSCCPANLSRLCVSQIDYEHLSPVPSLSSLSYVHKTKIRTPQFTVQGPPSTIFLSNWITSYYSTRNLQRRKVVSPVKIITSICWGLKVQHFLCWALYWHLIFLRVLWESYYLCHSDKETGLERLSKLPRS